MYYLKEVILKEFYEKMMSSFFTSDLSRTEKVRALVEETKKLSDDEYALLIKDCFTSVEGLEVFCKRCVIDKSFYEDAKRVFEKTKAPMTIDVVIGLGNQGVSIESGEDAYKLYMATLSERFEDENSDETNQELDLKLAQYHNVAIIKFGPQWYDEWFGSQDVWLEITKLPINDMELFILVMDSFLGAPTEPMTNKYNNIKEEKKMLVNENTVKSNGEGILGKAFNNEENLNGTEEDLAGEETLSSTEEKILSDLEDNDDAYYKDDSWGLKDYAIAAVGAVAVAGLAYVGYKAITGDSDDVVLIDNEQGESFSSMF